ncbi:MAG: DUF2911 domain-containing protein [Bacteroidota bacterium]
MKKSTLLAALFLAVTLIFTLDAQAQKFAKMDVSPLDASTYPSSNRISDKLIKIIYSRPQLKGRSLSKLAPNGRVWRTGANEAAEITFYTDVKMGGKPIKAGTYTFYTIPGDDEWTAIINSDLNVWGAYSYNEANDVARLQVSATSDDDSVEAFSIVFDEVDNVIQMCLGWGNTRVKVPFTK